MKNERGMQKGRTEDSICVEGVGSREDFRRWRFKNTLVLRSSMPK